MLANKGGFQFNDADSVVHKGKGKKGRKVKTKKQVLSFQTVRSRKERKLLLILRVPLEMTKCRQSPGFFLCFLFW